LILRVGVDTKHTLLDYLLPINDWI